LIRKRRATPKIQWKRDTFEEKRTERRARSGNFTRVAGKPYNLHASSCPRATEAVIDPSPMRLRATFRRVMVCALIAAHHTVAHHLVRHSTLGRDQK